jgi:hypothetical protein
MALFSNDGTQDVRRSLRNRFADSQVGPLFAQHRRFDCFRSLQALPFCRTESIAKSIARSKRVAAVKTKSLSRRHKTGQTAPTPTRPPILPNQHRKPQVSNPFPSVNPPETRNQTMLHPSISSPNNCPMRWQACKFRFKSVPSNFPFRHEPSNRTPPATPLTLLHLAPDYRNGSTRRDPPRCCIFDFRQSGAQIPWGFSANALNS